MANPIRAGTALLGAGGILLAALMAYTLLVEDPSTAPTAPPIRREAEAEVALFFPERGEWNDFRRGLTANLRLGLAEPLDGDDTTLRLLTPVHRRPVRFTWYSAGGQLGTREALRKACERPDPPIAVVGSSNTVLTVALAEQLRASTAANPAQAPLLLIPWATSVLVERPEPGAGPVALLDIHPGRTFRFCPNNQQVADLVVDCLAHHDAPALPGRAVLVVDRRDPYSADLADSFQRAIGRVAPRVQIVERPDVVDAQGLLEPIGPAEQDLADSIWKEAIADPDGQPTWVVLPLQSEPIRRLLAALRARARYAPGAPGDGPIRVVCGDAIGVETLREQAGNGAFPVWCVSSASAWADRLRQLGADEDTHVPAEIVSAVVRSLDTPADQPASAESLREALASLDLEAGEPGAFGRSLAFSPSGERRGGDLGLVLAAHPGSPDVLAIAPGPGGTWAAPGVVPVAIRP